MGHGHITSVFQGSAASPLPPWSPLGCLSLPCLHLELIPGCWPWSPPAVHLLGSSLQKGGRVQHPGRGFLCTTSRRMLLEARPLHARQNAAVHRGSASGDAVPGQLPGKCPPSFGGVHPRFTAMHTVSLGPHHSSRRGQEALCPLRVSSQPPERCRVGLSSVGPTAVPAWHEPRAVGVAPCVQPGAEALPLVYWPEMGSPDFSPLGVSERKNTHFSGCTGDKGDDIKPRPVRCIPV